MPNSIRPAHPDERPLLERILSTPHLAHVVPRLPPEVLHRIIQTCGLSDCGELIALATPGQLSRVLDLDLWRSDKPGREEALDALRFGEWLELLLDCGAAVAAAKLAGLGDDSVVAGLAQHVRVFDGAAASSYTTISGDEMPGRPHGDATSCEVGGCLVEARRTESWDAILGVLLFLDAERPVYFHRLMAGCKALSNSAPEVDGVHDRLTDRDQDMFDLTVDREERMDKQGYISPGQARVFLQMARHVQLTGETAPGADPIAGAYFRAIEWTAPEDAPSAPAGCAAALAGVVEALTDAGVLAQPPRALLEGETGDAPHLARIETQMRYARDRDPIAYAKRTEEFAFLANTIVAGCPIQGRPFTLREASDAIAAACNLGLENWPAQWAGGGTRLPDDFLVHHDLVGVFQVGWTVLHSRVAMFAAKQLVQVLSGLRFEDHEIQEGLDSLRLGMEKHWRAGEPWRARGALEVLVLLDMPAWAALLGLIDECPVIHGAIAASPGSRTRAISASAFEFISENSQIAAVHGFFESLATTLTS